MRGLHGNQNKEYSSTDSQRNMEEVKVFMYASKEIKYAMLRKLSPSFAKNTLNLAFS